MASDDGARSVEAALSELLGSPRDESSGGEPMGLIAASGPAAAVSTTSTEARIEGLKNLLKSCAKTGDADGLEVIVNRLVGDEGVPQHVARGALSILPETISMFPADSLEQAATGALNSLAPQVTSHEDVEYKVRQKLFDHLVNEGSFKEAALTLAAINLDARGKTYSDSEKAAMYVKIAETFLEDDESVDAEAYVSRASNLMHAVKQEDWALQLRYRVTLARTLDARRKFLEAAVSYYELSQARHEDVRSEDLVALLAKAVTCALLGNAGPQRSRILSTLYKDERVEAAMAASVEYAPHATVLSKMCTGQLVAKRDVAAFEATLLPHQKALLSDGLTIPERATIQHNLVALAFVYENVSFQEAGALLDIDPRKAMHLAARMIADHRLAATIDQVDGILIFAPGKNASSSSGGAATSSGSASSSAGNKANAAATSAAGNNNNNGHDEDDLAHICHSINLAYDKVEDILDRYNIKDSDVASAKAAASTAAGPPVPPAPALATAGI